MATQEIYQTLEMHKTRQHIQYPTLKKKATKKQTQSNSSYHVL